METELKKKGQKMRKWHKWAGLILSFFFIVFALSGIFLNHRKAISDIDIPRSYLSSDYRYNNWNNGALKGSFRISPDSVILYGGIGLLITDSLTSYISDYNRGLKTGADNRIIGNVVQTNNGDVFSITTFDLYKLDKQNNKWDLLSPELDNDERISDIQAKGDSLIILTRSYAFISLYPYKQFNKIELKAPDGYKKETSLFRFMWTLHSGELFGMPGKLFVDMLGIVSIILCITGIIFTIFPKIIKRRKARKKDSKLYHKVWKKSIKIHNKLGVTLLAFLLILVLSGTFLRPPLLIAIIRTKISTLPGTVLNDDNPWFDKLRCIRYDKVEKSWILYSSEGFYQLDNFESIPKKIQSPPPVSVMGITVFEQEESGQWLAGSFSGMYYWNRTTGKSIDTYTLRPAIIQRGGPPVITNAVSGYSSDFNEGVVFDYNLGARGLKQESKFVLMPDTIKNNGRMSLWHLCLEAHVGRIYSPIIGIFSDFFIFLSGALIISILVSGYFVYRKRYKKKISKISNK